MSKEGGIWLGSHVPSSMLEKKILLQKKKKDLALFGDQRAKYRPYRVSFPPSSEACPFEVHFQWDVDN